MFFLKRRCQNLELSCKIPLISELSQYTWSLEVKALVVKKKEFTRSVDKIEVFTHNDDVFEIDFNLTGNLCA